MTDDEGIDWSLTTWEGNRRRQGETFRALSFREKVEALERMSEVAALFARIRTSATNSPNRQTNDSPRR